ncbi:MAG: hypothetical protein F4W92_10875 [Gammaproteobacteria bacterium]|nr:hypothetical protein [Gammaproteobacteria bacterium]
MLKRIEKFDMRIGQVNTVRIEELIRLGTLKDGIQLTTLDIHLPIYGQVIPRIEVEILGNGFRKKVTVRVNQHSRFMFDGESIKASINGEIKSVFAYQYVDKDRAPTGMYNFGMLRENGTRSFVFDYHTYCAYSCAFCFKENEWEVLSIDGQGTKDYKGNYEDCLRYIETHAEDFQSNYDIVWLCTGSIVNVAVELQRHCGIAKKLREIGYPNDIYVSQVVPDAIRKDQDRRTDYLTELKESGVTRFNTGVEIVDSQLRKKYIQGYKGSFTFSDYLNIFEDAVDVFGHFGAGSCLLAGIEPSVNTLFGLEEIAKMGVVPAPTVFTPFVSKQEKIKFYFNLDELIEMHVKFNDIIERYKLPVFSGVFSLA